MPATQTTIPPSVFLQRFAPFNNMEQASLAFLAERIQSVSRKKGTVIVAPETGLPRFFYILQHGKIHARQADAATAGDAVGIPLEPGECFPIAALSSQRPSGNIYTAIEDSVLYRLPASDFFELMRISPVFHLFCTQYIASLLTQFRRQLQTVSSQRAAEQQTLTTPLEQLIKREPVSVSPDTLTHEALEKMAQTQVSCMAIIDAQRHPVGTLAHGDLLSRIVLPGFDLARPVGEIMTAAPYTLPASASAYDAALEMTTRNARHLLVVDGTGVLVGIVSERDLFALQRLSLRQIRLGIENADNLAELRRISEDIRQLALNLMAQDIGAEQLTRFISALNDALTQRIISLELSRRDLCEIDYAWLAFGSEGRREQTLSSDQDNGLVYLCPEGMCGSALKSRLLDFARAVNENLAACGFTLCKGNIMAGNPDLCLPLDEWQQRFDAWIDEPDPHALLNATIFFDFRVLSGNERFGETLRRHLNKAIDNTPVFLRMMAANALQIAPPLGRIRDFILDGDGSIDLKKYGARLFVDAARILALRIGSPSSGTVERLRQAGIKNGMPADEIAAFVNSFHFIQMLRLRSQHLGIDHGAPGDNHIRPGDLNELDRRILKEAFRQVRKLQLRLKLDYQL